MIIVIKEPEETTKEVPITLVDDKRYCGYCKNHVIEPCISRDQANMCLNNT